MDNDNGYPRYQYSVFPKNGIDSQFVIRNDDKDEFLEDLRWLQELIQAQKVKQTTQPIVPNKVIEEQTTEEPEHKPCLIHPGQNLYLKAGKFGPFYSHKIGETDNGKAIYCNGIK